MARRAGVTVLGRVKKRFIALAIGLLALAFVYSSSKRAKRAITNAGAPATGGAGGGDLDVKWTTFFGEGEDDGEVEGEDEGEEGENDPLDVSTGDAPADDGPAVEQPLEQEPEEAPSPSGSKSPAPKAPTPSKTAAKPRPSSSSTPAATSPPPTTSDTSKPVPPSPEAKKAEPAPGVPPAGIRRPDAPPQSQMQAAGDFLSDADVFRPRPPLTEEERKASPRYDKELDFDFKDTAFVTMAAGEDAGRQVIGLVSSLRASKTRVQDIVVMLSRGGMGSPECRGEDGGEWKKKHKREAISCSGADTVAEEIIGEALVNTLRTLGAVLLVVDPIPSTPFTEGIPGGRSFFWGMALNKLRVFNMTQYRKVIWMDSDTMVLQNVDHLFKEPMFTGAFTYACCNPNAPAIPSGGLWVLEPSLQTGSQLWQMMVVGKPAQDTKGHPVVEVGPNGLPVPKREYWHWGDMQLVRWFFSYWPLKFDREPLWPQIDDHNHGAVAGLQYYPGYKSKSQAELAAERRASTGETLSEGWHGKNWDGVSPVWRSLDARYDQCVGHCECLPQRDMPESHISLHFSCLQNGLNKPGGYKTEAEFGESMFNNAMSCTRYYSWHLWYQQYFIPAHGRLSEPYWTGAPIPGYNASHDEYVTAQRMSKKR